MLRSAVQRRDDDENPFRHDPSRDTTAQMMPPPAETELTRCSANAQHAARWRSERHLRICFLETGTTHGSFGSRIAPGRLQAEPPPAALLAEVPFGGDDGRRNVTEEPLDSRNSSRSPRFVAVREV